MHNDASPLSRVIIAMWLRLDPVFGRLFSRVCWLFTALAAFNVVAVVGKKMAAAAKHQSVLETIN